MTNFLTEDHTYAVLTGDIVNSRGMSADKLHYLLQEMKAATSTFKHHHPHSICGGLIVMQGDRWQILLKQPQKAPRIMTLLAASTRKLGHLTRIAVGVGSISRLDTENISESTGEAFTISGHALEKLEKLNYKKRYWSIGGASISRYHKILISILGDTARAWTQAQAEAVELVLRGLTTSEALSRLNIKQPAFAKRLSAAKWQYFDMVIEAFETIESASIP
jgi:hypothetical protein